MEFVYGKPFAGRELTRLKEFLRSSFLDYDDGIEFTVNLLDGDSIAATGSLQGNILKCIAVSRGLQGEGLAAAVVSELVGQAVRSGFQHLFLYTKPENERTFSELGFYRVAVTDAVLLMENRKNGARNYARSLIAQPDSAFFGGTVGAVVANCNPFTNGHLYLIEAAARACGLLYVFVLSEDRSTFSFETRMRLVRQGTAHLKNVAVCPTGDYLISSATFPDYFLKDKLRADDIHCGLDLLIFCECFAKELGITKRFAGTEPLDAVTAQYNRRMREFFGGTGIEFIEIERLMRRGEVVSASRVRRLLKAGDFETISELVPKTTFEYLMEEFA